MLTGIFLAYNNCNLEKNNLLNTLYKIEFAVPPALSGPTSTDFLSNLIIVTLQNLGIQDHSLKQVNKHSIISQLAGLFLIFWQLGKKKISGLSPNTVKRPILIFDNITSKGVNKWQATEETNNHFPKNTQWLLHTQAMQAAVIWPF